MKFSGLQRRVRRGEALVEGRIRQASECHQRMHREWRQAWSPLRIVLAGLATGFLAGRAQPEKALQKIGRLSGPRTLQLVTSVAGLVGSIQAAIAAMTAKHAAGTADEAASAAAEAGPGAGQAESGPGGGAAGEPAAAGAAPGGGRRRRADQQWDSPPSPAEAATEMSER